jgi:NAD+ diphosphatase
LSYYRLVADTKRYFYPDGRCTPRRYWVFAMQATSAHNVATPLQSAAIDGQTRRVATPPAAAMSSGTIPVPVVAAIVEMDGTVILARNKGWPEKMYGLITGFLEQGRNAGCRGSARSARRTGTGPRHRALHRLLPVLRDEPVDSGVSRPGARPITLGEELADIKRVPVERLKPWTIGTGPAVRDWLASRDASP